MKFNLMDLVKVKSQKKEDEPFVVTGRAIVEEPNSKKEVYWIRNSKAAHSLISVDILIPNGGE